MLRFASLGALISSAGLPLTRLEALTEFGFGPWYTNYRMPQRTQWFEPGRKGGLVLTLGEHPSTLSPSVAFSLPATTFRRQFEVSFFHPVVVHVGLFPTLC